MRATGARFDLLRHDAVAPDIHTRRLQRAVGLFRRAEDGEGGARLEVALVADHVADDWNVGRDDDLLLAVAIFHRHAVTVDGHHGLAADRAVGHRALRDRRIGPVTFAGAAHGIG